MPKKIKIKKKFKRLKKKKKFRKNDYHLPRIDVNPTLNKFHMGELPRIIIDCDAVVTENDIQLINNRLNFVDHSDLCKLYCIRIVNPGRILLPSKETTIGCYYRARGSQKAEVWISSDLIKTSTRFLNFLHWIFRRDRLFETLFHELGHHKSSQLNSIRKFKEEAFAETYMLAYKKHWNINFGPSRSIVKFAQLIRFIILKISLGVTYLFRKKHPDIENFYNYFAGNIKSDEFNELIFKSVGKDDNEQMKSKKTKKRWIHPLNRKGYRKKFNLPALR